MFPSSSRLRILAVLGAGESRAQLVINIVQLGCLALFFFRDSLFRGAGLGKRLTGLRVVQSKDGKTPLTYGQGVVRWLSQFIPFFNLYRCGGPVSRSLASPLGDRWAGTRVIDTERKLAKGPAKDRAATDQEGSSACAGVWDDHGGACSACLTTDARKLSTLCAGRGSSPLDSRTRSTSSAASSWRGRGASSIRERRYWAASEIASSGIAANCTAGRVGSDSLGGGEVRQERFGFHRLLVDDQRAGDQVAELAGCRG